MGQRCDAAHALAVKTVFPVKSGEYAVSARTVERRPP
jgi:hypothetical protein